MKIITYYFVVVMFAATIILLSFFTYYGNGKDCIGCLNTPIIITVSFITLVPVLVHPSLYWKSDMMKASKYVDIFSVVLYTSASQPAPLQNSVKKNMHVVFNAERHAIIKFRVNDVEYYHLIEESGIKT
jgi:hypothetical protein